jgi:hypothetical protein
VHPDRDRSEVHDEAAEERYENCEDEARDGDRIRRAHP